MNFSIMPVLLLSIPRKFLFSFPGTQIAGGGGGNGLPSSWIYLIENLPSVYKFCLPSWIIITSAWSETTWIFLYSSGQQARKPVCWKSELCLNSTNDLHVVWHVYSAVSKINLILALFADILHTQRFFPLYVKWFQIFGNANNSPPHSGPSDSVSSAFWQNLSPRPSGHLQILQSFGSGYPPCLHLFCVVF